MILRPLILSLALIAAQGTLSEVSAGGVPTLDIANKVINNKQLEILLKDFKVQGDILKQAAEQVKQLQAQVKQMQNIYDQFSGARDIIGMAMEGKLDGLLKGQLTDVMGTINAGMKGDWSGLNSEKSSALTKSVGKALSAAGFSQDKISTMAKSSDPGAKRMATQATGGAVLAASAEQTYSETGQSLERVNTLVELSQTSTDIKESVDLNTRMLAELSLQLAKSLELQSIEAVYNGQSGVISAATIAEERAYMVFSNE